MGLPERADYALHQKGRYQKTSNAWKCLHKVRKRWQSNKGYVRGIYAKY